MLGFYNYTVWLTYGSLVSAVIGIFVSLAGHGHPYIGAIFLLISGLCDAFDGMIARTKTDRTEQEKQYGIQIDSLSDLVAFGVLPACIGAGLYKASMIFDPPQDPCLVARVPYPVYVGIFVIYVLAALIRLAYFNVQAEAGCAAGEKVQKVYYGLPVTSSALIFPTFLLLRHLICADIAIGYYAVMLLTALACMPVWKQAVSLLREGKAGCELCAAVAVLTQLICCVCGVVTGSTRATPYAAAGALLILACQWGLYLEASALRNAYHLLVLNGTVPYVASVTAAGVCRQQGTAEGFYRLCSKPDPARRWQNYALPLVLATAAVLSGVVCFSGGNMSDFPWVLTALTTAGAGLGIPLSGALPMYYLSRRLSRSGCAAAGYAGAKAVSRPRRLVLTDDDLFPAGTVTLNGYKVFGEERSRAVSYAASVARAAGSSLTPLLERQLTAEGGFHLSVEWVNYCEEGGVEANIRGETVLMGSAYFMKKRKVALPRDMKLSTGVFLAVDGALTAVFAVKYQPSRNAEWALRTLKRFHIVPVLAVRSGNVTPGLIKRKFGVDAKPVYPDVSTRLALAQLAEQQGEQPCVAICREGLMPLVESVAGSRRAVKAVRTATILSYIGAAAGVALAYYLTSVGNFALLTPIAMVLYQVLWLLPTLLLAGLVKHY